jgi:hypothetical protein
MTGGHTHSQQQAPKSMQQQVMDLRWCQQPHQ